MSEKYEHLEAKVAAMKQKAAERKAEMEAEAAQTALAASRSCVLPESEAVETQKLADALLRQLTAGVKPADPEAVKSKAWDTVIAEELERNRIPKRYRYEMGDWGCVEQRKVFGLCRRVLVGTGAIVALIGLRGTGKTTLVSQIVIERCWQDWREIFVAQAKGVVSRWMPYRKMSDLIARFKPLYADFGSTNAEELIVARNSLCNADLLIIDELHDCDDQKMKDRILTDFADRRYAGMKDLVLISNQTEEEFQATTSDSVLSRIDEHGVIVPCQWASFRSKDPSMPTPRHAQP